MHILFVNVYDIYVLYTYFIFYHILLPRSVMHKHGLCHHAVSVCLNVRHIHVVSK